MKESHPVTPGGFNLSTGLGSFGFLALKIFDRSFTDFRPITLTQLP